MFQVREGKHHTHTQYLLILTYVSFSNYACLIITLNCQFCFISHYLANSIIQYSAPTNKFCNILSKWKFHFASFFSLSVHFVVKTLNYPLSCFTIISHITLLFLASVFFALAKISF